jgi:hypothetical protein
MRYDARAVDLVDAEALTKLLNTWADAGWVLHSQSITAPRTPPMKALLVFEKTDVSGTTPEPAD